VAVAEGVGVALDVGALLPVLLALDVTELVAETVKEGVLVTLRVRVAVLVAV